MARKRRKGPTPPAHHTVRVDQVLADDLNKTDPLDRLAYMATVRQQLDVWELQTIEYLRSQGVAWSLIGAQLGTSGQAVQQRVSRRS